MHSPVFLSLDNIYCMNTEKNKAGYKATSCGRLGSGTFQLERDDLSVTDRRKDKRRDGRTDKGS